MLVLSRQPGESILIGDDVFITVNRFKGNSVLIGVDAPRLVAVHRAEVYLALYGPDKLIGQSNNERHRRTLDRQNDR